MFLTVVNTWAQQEDPRMSTSQAQSNHCTFVTYLYCCIYHVSVSIMCKVQEISEFGHVYFALYTLSKISSVYLNNGESMVIGLLYLYRSDIGVELITMFSLCTQLLGCFVHL